MLIKLKYSNSFVRLKIFLFLQTMKVKEFTYFYIQNFVSFYYEFAQLKIYKALRFLVDWAAFWAAAASAFSNSLDLL